MGYCSLRYGVLTVVIFAAILFYSFPSDEEFLELSSPPNIPYKGVMAENNDLDLIKKLFVDELKGAESFSISGRIVYTGIHGAQILKIDIETETILERINYGPCHTSDQNLEIPQHREAECGRPLGLEIEHDQQSLIIADSSLGLLRMNLKDSEHPITTLVSSSTLIEGKPNLITNAVSIASNGMIYYTTSSTKFHLSQSFKELLTAPSGRLLSYDPKTKKNLVLVKDIRFANGVTLSTDESFLIYAETGTARLWKYYLTGKQKGERQLFAELPGLPDNIRKLEKSGYLVGIILSIHPNRFSFYRSLSSNTWQRILIAKTLGFIYTLADTVGQIYPNIISDLLMYWTFNLELARNMGPKYGLIVRLDNNGEIVQSWHSSSKFSAFSEAVFLPEENILLLGSPYNNYIGKLAYSGPSNTSELT